VTIKLRFLPLLVTFHLASALPARADGICRFIVSLHSGVLGLPFRVAHVEPRRELEAVVGFLDILYLAGRPKLKEKVLNEVIAVYRSEMDGDVAALGPRPKLRAVIAFLESRKASFTAEIMNRDPEVAAIAVLRGYLNLYREYAIFLDSKSLLQLSQQTRSVNWFELSDGLYEHYLLRILDLVGTYPGYDLANFSALSEVISNEHLSDHLLADLIRELDRHDALFARSLEQKSRKLWKSAYGARQEKIESLGRGKVKRKRPPLLDMTDFGHGRTAVPL
jgi:hypothetical protein